MKRQLLTLAISSGLAFGSLISVNAEPENDGGAHRHGGPGGWRDHNPMEHLTKKLDLTAEQQAKVQPIIDQGKPQMQAIHQEAMQKAKAVMDNTMDQIRPLLTPEQQQTLDAMKKRHEEMHNAHQQ